MADALPEYEVFAIRYATRDAKRREHFIMGDPHDTPMPMYYFVWAAKSPDRTFIIDTGFTAEEGAKRKRTFLRCPIDSLKLIGIDPDDVEDVILTHLHYDHVGNFHRFAKAQSICRNLRSTTRSAATCVITCCSTCSTSKTSSASFV